MLKIKKKKQETTNIYLSKSATLMYVSTPTLEEGRDFFLFFLLQI